MYADKYETLRGNRDISRRRGYANDAFNRPECVYAARCGVARLFCYTLREFAPHVSRTFTRLAGLNTHSGKLEKLISLARRALQANKVERHGKYVSQKHHSV
jgi:hypothetical protein